jgi:hypothetical protein
MMFRFAYSCLILLKLVQSCLEHYRFSLFFEHAVINITQYIFQHRLNANHNGLYSVVVSTLVFESVYYSNYREPEVRVRFLPSSSLIIC